MLGVGSESHSFVEKVEEEEAPERTLAEVRDLADPWLQVPYIHPGLLRSPVLETPCPRPAVALVTCSCSPKRVHTARAGLPAGPCRLAPGSSPAPSFLLPRKKGALLAAVH